MLGGWGYYGVVLRLWWALCVVAFGDTQLPKRLVVSVIRPKMSGVDESRFGKWIWEELRISGVKLTDSKSFGSIRKILAEMQRVLISHRI